MAKRPSYIRGVISNDDHTGKRVGNGGGGPHDPDMDARVAVLEQIAKQTSETLIGIRSDMADLRRKVDDGFKNARDDQRADFRWLLAAIIGLAGVALTLGAGMLGVMAKGFKWF